MSEKVAALRSHAGLGLLLLVVSPVMLWFTAQDGIASLGDDSVSYITMGRFYAGTVGEALLPWVRSQDHFPPLFPAALAVTGGASDLRLAHGLVAVFAVMSIALVYWYGLVRFARRAPALALAVLFVLAPGTWICVKGILSDSMYLALSLAAICLHERHAGSDRPATPSHSILLGLLLTAAWLTRQAGWILVIAYAVHAGLRARAMPRAMRWQLLAPLAIWAVSASAWSWIHSTGGTGQHRRLIEALLGAWHEHTGTLLEVTARILANSWVSLFAADDEVSVTVRVIVALVGVLGLAGAVRRALGNHMDGWYTLGVLAVVSFYIIQERDTRRVLYSILPLLLAHAGHLAVAAAGRLTTPRHGKIAMVGLAIAPALVCVPALVLILQKSGDTSPLVPEGQSARDITDYYTTINVTRARAIAARHAAVLGGLGRLKKATPGDARVMWIRPEYVALLGERHAVPSYLAWSDRRLAEAILASGTTHVVLATLFKSDLDDKLGDPLPVMATAIHYSQPEFSLRNPVTGREEFTLLKVQRERLVAYLSAAPGGR